MSAELQRQFLLRSFRLSAIRQRAIARLYLSGKIDQHLHHLRGLLLEQAGEMSKLLGQHLGDLVTYRMPAGGATFWLGVTRAVDMRKAFHYLLARQVVMAPGELFSVCGLHHQHLRLSNTFHGQPNLDSALALVGEALRDAQIS